MSTLSREMSDRLLKEGMMKRDAAVAMHHSDAFPKRCLPGAKVDLAGMRVTPAQSNKRLFRWRRKGVGWSRKALLPFPFRSQQRDPPIAREGE